MKILPKPFIKNTFHSSRKMYYIVCWGKPPPQLSQLFHFWPEYPVLPAITPLPALL